MGKYIQRIRETTKAAREADEKLQAHHVRSEEEFADANEKVWDRVDAQRRAGLARTSH